MFLKHASLFCSAFSNIFYYNWWLLLGPVLQIFLTSLGNKLPCFFTDWHLQPSLLLLDKTRSTQRIPRCNQGLVWKCLTIITNHKLTTPSCKLQKKKFILLDLVLSLSLATHCALKR